MEQNDERKGQGEETPIRLPGTGPPYVICSRATESLGVFVVLRDFDSRQIEKRRLEELRK